MPPSYACTAGIAEHAVAALSDVGRRKSMTSLDGADVVLQDDLLVGMVEAQVGKLTPMPPDPMTTGRDPPVTQQERMVSAVVRP